MLCKGMSTRKIDDSVESFITSEKRIHPSRQFTLEDQRPLSEMNSRAEVGCRHEVPRLNLPGSVQISVQASTASKEVKEKEQSCTYEKTRDEVP